MWACGRGDDFGHISPPWTSYGGHRMVDIVRWTSYVGHLTLDIVCWTSYVGHCTVDIVPIRDPTASPRALRGPVGTRRTPGGTI